LNPGCHQSLKKRSIAAYWRNSNDRIGAKPSQFFFTAFGQRPVNSLEKMKEQRQKDAERKSMNRANEIPEETKKRRQLNAERANINRANESPEKGNQRRQMEAERANMNRVNESPE
jgi:hypothetical protein